MSWSPRRFPTEFVWNDLWVLINVILDSGIRRSYSYWLNLLRSWPDAGPTCKTILLINKSTTQRDINIQIDVKRSLGTCTRDGKAIVLSLKTYVSRLYIHACHTFSSDNFRSSSHVLRTDVRYTTRFPFCCVLIQAKFTCILQGHFSYTCQVYPGYFRECHWFQRGSRKYSG